jgi:galactokinase
MNFPGFDMTITSELVPADGIGVDNALHIATALVLKKFFYPDISDDKLIECVAHGLMIFFGSFISYADIFTPFYAKKDSCIISNLASKTYEVVPFFEKSTIVIVDSRIPGMEYWNENSIYAPANADLLSKLKIIQNGKQVYVDLRSDKASLLLEADEEVRRCVTGIIKEASYTTNAIRAVKAGDHSVFAREVNRSNELFSDAFLFSRPEVDWIVKRSHEFDQPAGKPTFACARMIGKKFGRYVVTIMSDEFLNTYIEKIGEYEKIFGFSSLCRVFKPGDGYEFLWSKD